VLYATYTRGGRTVVKPDVELQVKNSGDWFYIGFQCLHLRKATSVDPDDSLTSPAA
jgi:hypothetical protein